MYGQLTYMPVLRVKQEERAILESFSFGTEIFPCLEIFKEYSSQTKKGMTRSFGETYLPLINKIKASNVFIDLPVHLKPQKRMKKEVLDFLTRIVASRENRTKFISQLSPAAGKIIPVISSYWQRTGETGSILSQETDLRRVFSRLAFRTFPETLDSDLEQISKVAQAQDYLIIDLGEHIADPTEEYYIQPVIDSLSRFSTCKIVILSSAIPNKLTNKGLAHTLKIDTADNRLHATFRFLKGHCFGDYVGIKRDEVTEGGAISPGFILYDAVQNAFYGFRGSDKPKLEDFETIVVPAVLESEAAARMEAADLPYLNVKNNGWSTLLKIRHELESGQHQGKFKRISMEHYLHCISLKIKANRFSS